MLILPVSPADGVDMLKDYGGWALYMLYLIKVVRSW
jgi:hypothetical protein